MKENIEIIIVENGSTDCTFQLAKSLMDKDDRIKVIQSEKGVSKARNTGIDASSGKWILFLDADDRYTEDAFAVLSKYSDSESDLILFGHYHGTKSVPVTSEDEEFFDDVESAKDNMISAPTVYMPAFSKLFRRNIIVGNGICFDSEMSISEDSDFVIQYLMKCKSIVFSKEFIYVYSIDNESTMRSYDEQRVERFIKALYKTSKKIEGETTSIRKAYGRYVLQNVNVMMVRGPFSIDCPKKYGYKRQVLKRVAETGLVKASLGQLSISDIRNLRLIPLLMLKCRLYSLVGLVYTIRAYHNHKSMNKK